MKSSSQSSVSHVLVISFLFFASLILFVSRAAAQEIGTVNNPGGGTTTTERDTRYGTYGVKVTIKDSKGRVFSEEWKGNKDNSGNRITLEENHTIFDKKNGGKTVFMKIFRPGPGPDGREKITEKIVQTDALGGVISEETNRYDKSEQTEGTIISVDPNSGKKTTKKYDPKTKKYEDVEPAKTEEPKKETPNPGNPGDRQTIDDTGFEFFGGFTYMRAPDESAKNLVGFNGSLFYDFTPHVAVGGDLGVVFGSTTNTIGTTKIDTSLHRQTFLFGPQFYFPRRDPGKVTPRPFVHWLVGGVHDTTRTTIGTTSVSSSATAFAMAIGGGVDINLNNHFAFRPIQFDYVPTHFGGAWQSNYRISTGLVIRFGGKK